MRQLFQELGRILRSGEAAVLVSVIASSGSTPRGEGAHMLVTAGGRRCGTIGGGAVEHEGEKMALEVLRTGSSRTEHYRLHPNEVQDLGMVCGGDVEVYFLYIPAGDPVTPALADRIEELYHRAEPCWLVMEITPGQCGALGIYSGENGAFGIDIPSGLAGQLAGGAAQVELDGRLFYCEALVKPGWVYVFGGGHVSQALVPVLAAVDFRCMVLEDRGEFCREDLFAGVEEIRMIDNRRIQDAVTIGGDDYVVIMTRGHKDDQLIQAQILRTPARYIGVIGSRRKAAAVRANLRGMGFTDGELDRIITPIGLDIGAETPAEIAVSIAAQLIQERAARK